MVIELAIVHATQDFGFGAKTEPKIHRMSRERSDVAWLLHPLKPNARDQSIHPEDVVLLAESEMQDKEDFVTEKLRQFDLVRELKMERPGSFLVSYRSFSEFGSSLKLGGPRSRWVFLTVFRQRRFEYPDGLTNSPIKSINWRDA